MVNINKKENKITCIGELWAAIAVNPTISLGRVSNNTALHSFLLIND